MIRAANSDLMEEIAKKLECSEEPRSKILTALIRQISGEYDPEFGEYTDELFSNNTSFERHTEHAETMED